MNRPRRLLAACLSVALFLSFCACKDDAPDPSEQTILYSMDHEPASLDPQIAADEASRLALVNLFEGLCRLDGDGNAVPGVAERWEANADFTQFTFYLREDAAWSDGTPVTADDFVFGLQRALSPQTNSPTCDPLFCIRNGEAVHRGELPEDQLGVHAVGEHQLVIDLEYSYENFPRLTAIPPAMPCNRDFFEASGGRYGLEADCLLSNGAFRLQKYGWEHGDYLRLSRNTHYAGEQEPVPAGVRFTIGADVSDAVAAILGGTVDAAPLKSSQLAQAEEEGLLLTSFQDTVWGLCFNLSDPVFQNLNIRKSFVQSLDRDYVLSSLPETFAAGDHIILPGMTLGGEEYRPLAGGPFFPAETDNSAELLAAGLSELERQALPGVSILCLDDPSVRAMVNNMIETWNKTLGTYLNMQPLSQKDLEQAVQSGNYQLAFTSLRAESESVLDLLSLFGSQNALNPARLNSTAYDSLLAAANELPGLQSLETCTAMEKYLNEQVIFYPLCYENRYFAASPAVTGLVFRPYGGGVDFYSATKQTA